MRGLLPSDGKALGLLNYTYTTLAAIWTRACWYLFRLIPVYTMFRNISASFRNESSLFQNESCIALIGSIPDCLPYSGKDL